MSLTYLELVNQVLRRVNEVELNSSEFSTTNGLHSAAKDAVNNSILRINSAEFEWPFNGATHTETLVAGTEEYLFPSDLKTVDFNSFQIQKDGTHSTVFRTLRKIERDEYFNLYRDTDETSGTDGRGMPEFVYMAHGAGSTGQDLKFGVTPSPDKAYELKFNYFAVPATLSAHDSVTRIPDHFEHIIVDGAVYFMYVFKENMEAAQMALMNFQQGIKDMQSQTINSYERITDRRVQYGGGKIGVQVADRM